MKASEKKLNIISKLMLLAATVIWGSSFFILKNTLDELPTFFLLSFRFLVAAVILSVVFFRRFKRLNLKHIWAGLLTGLALGIAYATQTVGLKNTTPGINAFLTATYCILVPFFMWRITKKSPDRYNIIAAVFCLTGIGLICLGSGFGGFNFMGEGLTLICGVFFALQIVAVAVWGEELDLIVFTVFQFLAAFLVCLVCFFINGEQIPSRISAGSWISLAFLTLMCTLVCFLFMNFGIKHTSASYSSLVLCLEAVFGVLFSIVFYHEQVTLKIGCGFAVIFIGIVINETKLSFLKKKKEQ